MLTKDDVSTLLTQNDKAVCRALVLLTERQTSDEKRDETTKHRNERGFKPCHARMGTSMAQFFLRTGYLSPKQLAYWRRPDASGAPRLACYWRQLNEEAERKKHA